MDVPGSSSATQEKSRAVRLRAAYYRTALRYAPLMDAALYRGVNWIPDCLASNRINFVPGE
jgi:hypothetical protein